MKLYAHPTTPRCNPFYREITTPAATYRLQQQLLKAYREVLFHWWPLDVLVVCCFGPKTGKRLSAAEDRLQYEVPELLERMSPDELEEAATVFYAQTLVGFAWHVLAQERKIQHRLDEICNDRLSDERHAKAASLGQGTWRRGKRTPNPVPCACQQAQSELPPLVLHLPTPVVATRPPSAPLTTPVATLSAHTLLYQVKRTQERRRLKRKRR